MTQQTANQNVRGGRRGRDRMIVGFTITYAISVYHHRCCELESRSGRGVQHYVIKCVSDFRQVGGFHHQTNKLKARKTIGNSTYYAFLFPWQLTNAQLLKENL